MILSDAPNFGITHDDSKGVIYDCNFFIIQATSVDTYGSSLSVGFEVSR